MRILLWRAWEPPYSLGATFTTLLEQGIGGTCIQLLWHARNMRSLGHDVQVLGMTNEDVVEEDIEFVGARERRAQEAVLRSSRIAKPEVIFLEGGAASAPLMRELYARARIVHVAQNFDRVSYRSALAVEPFVDVYACVSPGHLAYLCSAFPRLRHKLSLVRNAVSPWAFASGPRTTSRRIAWVGGWTKRGLRQWAEAVAVAFEAAASDWVWHLFVTKYSSNPDHQPPAEILGGLKLPMDRIRIRSVSPVVLAAQLAESRIVLVSLGNETCCIAALDGHAAGRPVLSGNDLIFKYVNPEGTGLRVTTPHECLSALRLLMSNESLCDSLGQRGGALASRHFSLSSQRQDLEELLAYLAMMDRLGGTATTPSPTKHRDWLNWQHEQVLRRLRKVGNLSLRRTRN